MNPVHDLSLGKPPDELNVFIEIPRGAKNKYEIDKESGLVVLDRVLPWSHAYPLDYGLLPRTLWHDGDQLDALVINSAEPYYPGVVVPTRPVGLVRMTDKGEKDEKLICVPLDDPRIEKLKDKDDINPHLLVELKNFFENYKLKTKVTVHGFEDRAAAVKVVQEAVELYNKQGK